MKLTVKGREFLSKHPDAKPVDLVEHCGFSMAYAKVFLSEEKRKKNNAKYLADRPKKVVKPKEPKPKVAKPKVAKPKVVFEKIIDWEKNYRSALAHIQKLEKQNRDYNAVIGYLEHLLAKHGSSV